MIEESGRTLTLSEVLAEEQAALGDPLPAADTLDETFGLLHGAKRVALCLSGGGARSAIFCLGVMQGMAKAGLLDKIDYVSTVGGGGWTGSWLSARACRIDGGWKGAVSQLSQPARSGLSAEMAPLDQLRQFTAYLNPFSAQPALWGTQVLSNMLVNWLLLGPLLCAILLAPQVFLELLRLKTGIAAAHVALAAGAAFAALFVGRMVYTEEHSSARGEGDAWLSLLAALAAICISLAWAWYDQSPHSRPEYWHFLLIALVVCFAGRVLGWLGAGAQRQYLISWIWTMLAAVAASAGAFALARTFPHSRGMSGQLLFASFGPPLFLTVIVLSVILLVAIGSFILWDESRRRWTEKVSSNALVLALGWALANFSTLYFPTILVGLARPIRIWFLAGGAAAAVITLLSGYSATTADEVKQILGSVVGIPFLKVVPELVTGVVLLLAPPAAVLWVLLLASLASVSIARFATTVLHRPPSWEMLLITGAVLASLGATLGRLVTLNKFSLNSMYRERLIAVFLGASNPLRSNRFSSFDASDNLSLCELIRRPLQILNLSVFLTTPKRLATTNVAETFTISALHAGSPFLGYCPMRGYAGMSLGTAMAISGSTSGPGVGYSSSSAVRFILNLFNARLGWWLPNPGPAGRTCRHIASPRFATGALWRDILGRGTDASRYVHCGDGGHFDNLGIYQMVLRRCALIVAVDATQDPKYRFEELGAALRRIQLDLGIPVEFPQGVPGKGETVPRGHSAGRIRYSAVDAGAPDGILLYLRPVVTGNEDVPIHAYASGHPDFPHQIMEGKEFDEAQFEAYRQLGLHTIGEALPGEPVPATIADWIQCLRLDRT